MSKIYSSLEAAEFIGTSARLLRRFIRQNDSWKNATYAGRYSFTEAEVNSLKLQFEKWQGGRTTRRPAASGVESNELTHLDEDQGITVEQMHQARRNPELRKMIQANRIARQRKLNERIREVGLSSLGLNDKAEKLDSVEYYDRIAN